jgi:DNA primase
MSERIPREFIQLLLSRIELVDFIDTRIPLRKKTGSNYFACCPFHQEKSASFSVSHTKQFYYCFGCGAHGNAIDFLMQYDHLSFPEAIEALARHAGLEIPRDTIHAPVEKKISYDSLYDLLTHVSKFYQTELRREERAIAYFKKRGVSGEIAKTFEIGFAPPGWDHVLQAFGKTSLLKQQLLDTGMLIKKEDGGYYDRFRDRVMFPIHDRRGRIIGFGGRIIDQGEPKYLNSPETPLFQKSHELYGLYHTLKANRELSRVLIVEGYMDVISLFQHGITYAVATLGTATSAHHLQRLFRHTSEIVFCFDGDQAGRTAGWRALQVTLPLMRDGIQMRFMFLPESEDPDSLIRKEGKKPFEERIKNATTLSQFFFQSVSHEADLGSLDGRARFIKLATDYLKQMPESMFQTMMFSELAKKAQVDIERVKPTTTTPYKSSLHKARSPSILRLAMALLIREPQLAIHLTEPLPPLEMKGYDLFCEIVDVAKHNPGITAAALYEIWRDRPTEANIIAKLAEPDDVIPEKGIQHEFLGAIQRLKELANEQLIERLLAKATQNGLTQEEKQTLHALIHSKQ